jgi:pimeloyl-ACP methyl ester carboxylesterase
MYPRMEWIDVVLRLAVRKVGLAVISSLPTYGITAAYDRSDFVLPCEIGIFREQNLECHCSRSFRYCHKQLSSCAAYALSSCVRFSDHKSGRLARFTKKLVLLIVGIAVIYFCTPVLILRFALDRLIFLQVDSGPTHEGRQIDVLLARGRSLRIREYGSPELPNCAIFFPGQHGGIATYERTLFPTIEQLGITVYALSYPGQDGAQGRSRRSTLIEDADRAIAVFGRKTPCQPADSVFVGRSLGASVAIHAAQQTPPKGLLLDGVSPTLIVGIQAALRRRAVTRPWNLLPLSLIVEDDSLIPVIRSLRSIPIVIFQGTNDRVTPFDDAQKALLDQVNVQFFAVPGATHSDAYLRAQPMYSKKLAELAAR